MPVIPNCADCKHFCEGIDTSRPFLGWCDVRLPPWLIREFPKIEECSRTVRKDDSCSLFVDKS